MDKFTFRTFLFDKVYNYLKENPNKLTKQQQEKLLNDVTKLTKTLEKVESLELLTFLQHINLIEKVTETTQDKTNNSNLKGV